MIKYFHVHDLISYSLPSHVGGLKRSNAKDTDLESEDVA